MIAYTVARSMEISLLKEKFTGVFGHPPAGAAGAPGRVNLIGEHTDYNDGFVLPIAIDRQTVALWAPRSDGKIVFQSLQQSEAGLIDVNSAIEPSPPQWANYCKGVACGLVDSGVKLAGCDILFDSDVPIGGGLSSSASLEVAAALALLGAAGAAGSLPDRQLALLCQKAENEFACAPCGIMDQSIVVMARAGRAMLLDCRSGDTRQVPFDDPSVVLLVADTQVSHDIGGAGYPLRRAQCESAARKLSVAALRDVSPVDLASAGDKLDEAEMMRARHVVSEIDRTLRAVEALEAGDYHTFGRLMYDSHDSLRDDFQVSCEELDAIVAAARNCDGVHGARMTGGGFGGCAIVLADAAQANAVAEDIANRFERRFARRCPIFATRPCDGASVIALKN